MAYVRKRGSQVAIVHGERDPDTSKVQQRILFTLYSKAEAREALGKRKNGGDERFRSLLEHQYPQIKFDWNKICRGIKANMDVLPDLYEYHNTRLLSRFRKDLATFAKQLVLADPQALISAAQVIKEHRLELEYLTELIQWRLNLCAQKEDEQNADDLFYWRFALPGSGVPPEAEEHAAGYYQRGENDKAEAVFRLLADCFDGYAEGYNYLGLIALEQGRLEEAIGHFGKTVELGRKMFPKRMPKSRYWSDVSTRPFIRGLRNFGIALNRAARYLEAIDVSSRLEHECGDDLTSSALRAAVNLNLGRWEEAADAAISLHELDASRSLVAAIALFELGKLEDALSFFLHGALSHPWAARMVVGERGAKPKSPHAFEDLVLGMALSWDIHGFLSSRRRKWSRFFKKVLKDPRVDALLDETVQVVDQWREQCKSGDRGAYDRMMLMRTPEFARHEAGKLADLLEG